MAFSTWLKNLITKGKALIKKAAPAIRKGIKIAKKVAPVIGGSVGSVINSISNVIDKVLNKIAPIKQLTFNLSDSDGEDNHETYDSESSAAYVSKEPKINERRIRIGDNGN